MITSLIPMEVMHMHGGGFGGLLFPLLVGALIFWLVRSGKVGAPATWFKGGQPENRARETLAERLASGDITPEEYRERLAVLNDNSPGGPNTDLR